MKDSELCKRIYEKLNGVGTILDVGCDAGNLVTCLAKKTKKKVVGLDVSPDGFNKAKRKAKRGGVSSMISCVRGDAHKISNIFDERFDAVTLTYTLHHLNKPELALKEIWKIIKPKGMILIADLILEKGKEKKGCYQYTSKELYKMVKNAGYKKLSAEQIEEDSIIMVGKK